MGGVDGFLDLVDACPAEQLEWPRRRWIAGS